MRYFLIALQFLTILPVRGKQWIKEKDYAESLMFFPVIGLIIGLLLCLVLFIFRDSPVQIQAAFLIISSVVITGGLHLDGFADTCDGFCGVRSKEQILQIMKDSHTGVMGVIAIVCLLLLKYTLIINISYSVLWKSVIIMVVLSRWLQAFACYLAPYPREDGKAKCFIEHANRRVVIIGGFFSFCLCALLIKLEGVLIFTLVSLCVFLFTQCVKRKIGGITGDTVGSVNEIAEVLVLLLCFLAE